MTHLPQIAVRRRFTLALIGGLFATSMGLAQTTTTAYSNDFSAGINGANVNTANSNWYTYNATSLSTTSSDNGMLNLAGSGTANTNLRGAELNFGQQYLNASGDSLTVSLGMKINQFYSGTGNIRIGLYSSNPTGSNPTMLTANTTNTAVAGAYTGREGYWFTLDTRAPGSASGSSLSYIDTTSTSAFNGSTNPNLKNPFVLGNANNKFDVGKTLNLVYSLTRNDSDYTLALAYKSVDGLTTYASGSVAVSSIAGTALSQNSLDTLVLVGIGDATNNFNFSIDNLVITTASAIPEPSTYAALAGLGILGFAIYRRRRAA